MQFSVGFYGVLETATHYQYLQCHSQVYRSTHRRRPRLDGNASEVRGSGAPPLLCIMVLASSSTISLTIFIQYCSYNTSHQEELPRPPKELCKQTHQLARGFTNAAVQPSTRRCRVPLPSMHPLKPTSPDTRQIQRNALQLLLIEVDRGLISGMYWRQETHQSC
jgi:hypothetical protein